MASSKDDADDGVVLTPKDQQIQVLDLDEPEESEEGAQSDPEYGSQTHDRSDERRPKDYYMQKYKSEWELIPEIKDWLRPVPEDIYMARCAFCNTYLRCHKKKLFQHRDSKKHQLGVLLHRNRPSSDLVDIPPTPLRQRRERASNPRRARTDGGSKCRTIANDERKERPRKKRVRDEDEHVGDVSYSDSGRITYSIGLGGNKLGFIGAGTIAQAICLSLLDKGVIHPSSIMASAPSSAHLSTWASWGTMVTHSNNDVMVNCELVVLAVPPEEAEEVLQALQPPAKSQVDVKSLERCFISLVPGLSRDRIGSILMPKFDKLWGAGSLHVIRCMVSLSVRAGHGCCAYSLPVRLPSRWLLQLEVICGALGLSEQLADRLLEPFAAAFGSGPALSAAFADALTHAAAGCGLPWASARKMAAQTLVGTGHLLSEERTGSAPLSQEAAPPASGALAALLAFDQGHVRSSVASAVQACLQQLERTSQ